MRLPHTVICSDHVILVPTINANIITESWNPCEDRNLLPKFWAAVERAGQQQEFGGVLEALAGRIEQPYLGDRWYLATASPRLHVIAALKVCDQWPDEWSSGLD